MDLVGIGVALVIGLAVGYAAAAFGGKKEEPEVEASEKHWWDVRKTLTGTQLQILQYMEAKKGATLTQLHEKFSFIPDRELYYRLEQIVLMNFVIRDRKDNEVTYSLNDEYSGTVEDDKTVMLPQDK